eukprot:257337-Hanusia_phi.AAC.2
MIRSSASGRGNRTPAEVLNDSNCLSNAGEKNITRSEDSDHSTQPWHGGTAGSRTVGWDHVRCAEVTAVMVLAAIMNKPGPRAGAALSGNRSRGAAEGLLRRPRHKLSDFTLSDRTVWYRESDRHGDPVKKSHSAAGLSA